MKPKKYDFGGWATRNNLRCSDGRTIVRDAFKDCDGLTRPLVWNHQHNSPDNVLGHAVLENRADGVYAYCSFNDTENGQKAKKIVEHGDVVALSIFANQLKQDGSRVIHGAIKEVSLVLAGANPGALINSVMAHGEETDAAEIYNGLDYIEFSLEHSEDERESEDNSSEQTEEPPAENDIAHSDDGEKVESTKSGKGKTLEDVLKTLSKEQLTAVYGVLGAAFVAEIEDREDNSYTGEPEEDENKVKHSEGGNDSMKKHLFDPENNNEGVVLAHSDQEMILEAAKSKSIGSLRDAIEMFVEQNSTTLKHGIDDIDSLFPDYRDVKPGAPDMVTRDQGWITAVMNKTHKTPFSRIRTRQTDLRSKDLRGSGYKKGEKKQNVVNMNALTRTTDPQTIYVKDHLDRDDIVDLVDFDAVEYQYGAMRLLLNEEVATAITISDGREADDKQKIHQQHVRSIWHDDELYCIHVDVDVEKARNELQGTDTGANFGDNFVYSEAVITAALHSRENFKGSGTPDFFCTPHLLNIMLLARDRNGHRMYESRSDLAAALNVGEIYTAEQFEGQIRTDDDGNKHKLLGIFVNLLDYTIGAAKGGEITRFNQFDIDFNQEKYLLEARMSGALNRINSAIALEEPVNQPSARTPGNTNATAA